MPALIQTVALAGVGSLGAFVLDELVAAGFKTTVLTRAGSSKSVPAGVAVKEVDYDSSASLVTALAGLDAVVSTLASPDAQAALIRAAAAAGVKLFVPSEFGNPSTELTKEDHPVLYGKRVAQDLLKEAGLPALLVWCGPFTDTTLNPYFGIDFAAGKVTILGTGRTPISWTTRHDIARFTAHHLASLTSLPPVGTPEILRIEGDRKSFLDVVETFRALHPERTIEVGHVPLADGEKVARNVGADFLASLIAYLRVSWEKGVTVDEGGKARLSNELWPEWNPKTVADVLKAQTA